MQKGKRDLDTKKRAKRRQQRMILQGLLILFVLVGLSALIYSVPRFPQLTIAAVTVKGNEVVTVDTIRAKAEDGLHGLYFYLFPKRASFLYPKEALEKSIVALDPHILSASVSLANLKEMEVSVVERKPYALFCNMTEATSTEPCYFLDTEGFVYSEAPEFSDTLFTTYYGTTTLPRITAQFLPPAEFKAIAYTVKQLGKLNHKIDSVSVKDGGLIEMKMATGGKLLFAENGDYGGALNNFEALIQSADFKAKDTAGILQVDYIDLRFGNKVFYKPL